VANVDNVDAHKHNGMRTYAGAEATNVILGQNGFDILRGAADTTGIEYIAGETGTDTADIIYKPGVRFWVAVKAMNGADSSLEAYSLQGMHLSTDGTYTGSTASSTKNIDLQDQDVINGCFTKIRICDVATFILAYRG
tara:strand:- start:696 stop:1109 length:414 start_codon:yes stop_codon:yes gene_type:complete